MIGLNFTTRSADAREDPRSHCMGFMFWGSFQFTYRVRAADPDACLVVGVSRAPAFRQTCHMRALCTRIPRIDGRLTAILLLAAVLLSVQFCPWLHS